MKEKKSKFKKIELNKQTIARLNSLSLDKLKGGGVPPTTSKYYCGDSEQIKQGTRPGTTSKNSAGGSCYSDCYC